MKIPVFGGLCLFFLIANFSVTMVKPLDKDYTVVSKPTGLQLRGFIESSDKNELLPEYTILFRGSQTKSNSEGFFVFPLASECEDTFTQYRLLLIKRVAYAYEKVNTIKGLSIPTNEPYRLFDCFKDATGQWTFREITDQSSNILDISDSTLIILINPKYVQAVQPWKIALPASVIKVPKLTLSSGKDYSRAANKSVLNALDGQVYHETITHEHRYSESGLSKMSIVK